jgi:hypothetical protein
MPPTRLQLEGPSLEELLGRVQREHGAGARILQAEKVRTGGVGGFFAREVYRIDVEVEQPAAQPATARVVAPLSLLDLADAVSDEEAAGTAAAPPAPAAIPTPRPALRRPSLSTESPTFAAVLAGLAADAADDDELVPLPGRRRAGRRNAAEAPVTEEPVTEEPVAAPTVLRVLPTPEPVAPVPAYVAGQVVVVAGELQLALRAVQAVARELGVERPDAFVASTDPARVRDVRPARRLVDPARVPALRARWVRRQEVTFVVVDAPLLLRPEGWARSMLQALGAGVTWGAVSATTKVADIGRWVDRLGGVDLLSVHDLEATVDARELLGGRWQVGLVDGSRPAAAAAETRPAQGRGVA